MIGPHNVDRAPMCQSRSPLQGRQLALSGVFGPVGFFRPLREDSVMSGATVA
jgi:hypothetical protein